jgi:predicted permease
MLEQVWRDLIFGARTQLKTPAVSIAIVLTLAFGVAATSATFSMINGYFLRPLPAVERAGELVRIYSSYASGMEYFTVSHPDYADIRELRDVFADVVAENPIAVTLGVSGSGERVWSELVSGGYFSVLGVRPALGRFFTIEEERRRGGDPVAVLGHGLWKRRFGASRDVIGRTVLVNNRAVKVIGVAPEAFHGMTVGLVPDLWVPSVMAERIFTIAAWLDAREARSYFATGRLQPGVTVERARAALDVLARRLQRLFPATNQGVRFTAVSETESRVHPMFRGSVLSVAAVSAAVAVLMLLLACANVAGVLLGRASARRKEIGVRLALGATRSRLLRQLLTESMLLSALAGAAGLALTWGLTRLLGAIHIPTRIPLFIDLDVDARVLAFGVVVTVATGILFGLVPALEGSRCDPVSMVNEHDPSGGRGQSRLRSTLLAGQVALSIVLLVGGGLFIRSLQNAQRIDLGFEPDGVAVASMDLWLQGYSRAETKQFWRRLVDRVGALPGAQSVSLASAVPFELNITVTTLGPEGFVPHADRGWPVVDFTTVDVGYFETMRIPLLVGRGFTDRDGESEPDVIVVNDVLARQFWPGGEAVGRRVTNRSGRSFEVVGVARRGRYLTLGEDPKPFVYFALRQSGARAMTVIVRGADSKTLLKQVQDIVHSMDATVPLYDVMTMSTHVAAALAPAESGAAAIGIIGLLALALTSLGLYGTVAHTVGRRTYEIGVRRALGAQDGDVVWLVVRDATALVAVGLVCGAAAAVAGSRVLRGLLYGVGTTDPLAFGLAPVVLVVVCVTAAWLPTRRAVRVDAAGALRRE